MIRSGAVLPYRVLPSDAVSANGGGWSLLVGGEAAGVLLDGAPFNNWDARLEFSLEREFEIHVPLADALGLRPLPRMFELVVTALSAGGAYREVLSRTTLPENDPGSITTTVDPPSDRLAKDLVLRTGVYVVRSGSQRDPLAPILPGSPVWETTEQFRLEGGAARLPIYEVPFSKAFPGEEIGSADYHVEVADEAELEFESGLTVYLNSERPPFITELRKGGPAERRLWAGIIRRALARAALSTEFLQPASHGAGTIAGTATRWASQIWPNTPPSALRDLVSSDFSKFEARIESWVEALHEAKTGGVK